MNKKMRELLAAIESKTKEAAGYLDGENKDVTKANTLLDEVDSLKAEFAAEKRIYDLEKAKNEPDENEKKNNEQIDSVKAFAGAVRSIAKGMLVEGTDANGGYTVPEDIQTQINQYKTAEFSLLSLVDVESVSTNKGARTYQKKAQVAGFAETDEAGAVTEIAAPSFERLTYSIKDYTGFMPITDDLLNDSDQNLTTVIAQWFARNSVATANKLILAKIQGKTETDLVDIDGIKKAINVTLGQAYKGGAIIVTNDDGLNYLDTLKDTTGRPLLNPDPTAPANLQLRCGVNVVPVRVIPNAVLATAESKIPFYVGDFKEAIKYWDRQQNTLIASNVAAIGTVNAFAQNLTLFKGIEREDVTLKDSDSFVNGYITGE